MCRDLYGFIYGFIWICSSEPEKIRWISMDLWMLNDDDAPQKMV